MIELTRLNGMPLYVNSDLVKFMEAAPDTMLTLLNGEKVIVREGCTQVAELILQYRSRLLAEASRLAPGGSNILTSSSAMGTVSEEQARAWAEFDEEAARRRRRSS